MSGILASLLPGIRDLRAPLAAGYLWLASLWVLWGRKQSGLDHDSGLAGDVYRLAKSAGPLATAVALSFAAYVIGVLWWALYAWVIGRAFHYPLGALVLDKRTIDESIEQWARRIDAELGYEYVSDTDSLRRWRESLDDELELVPFRLMGKEPELYGEYDRLRAEGEFRFEISTPLTILIAVHAAETSAWWYLVAFPFGLALSVTGLRQMASATDILLDAIRANRVESRALETMEAELTRRRSNSRQ